MLEARARKAAYLSAGLLLVACSAEVGEAGETRIAIIGAEVDSMNGEPAVVDLASDEAAYVVNRASSPVDLANTDIVCPNGATARFEDWAAHQEPALRGVLSDPERRGFVVATSDDAGRDAVELVDYDAGCSCDAVCDQCPDGAVVCWLECDDPACAFFSGN